MYDVNSINKKSQKLKKITNGCTNRSPSKVVKKCGTEIEKSILVKTKLFSIQHSHTRKQKLQYFKDSIFFLNRSRKTRTVYHPTNKSKEIL